MEIGESDEAFFLGEDGVIYENTETGGLIEDYTENPIRMVCKPEGLDARELRENTAFLLDLLNEYANREITTEDLEAVHVD